MKCVIVFTDFNFRAVIAFLRTLTVHNIKFAIVAISKNDQIFETSYANQVFYVRKNKALLLDETLQAISEIKSKMNAEEYWLMPSTEALNRFLLKNQIELNKQMCFIPLVKLSLYEMISDKESFGKICKDNDILIPKQFNSPNELQLPFVAKPKKYVSSNGNINIPVIMTHSDELSNFLNKYDLAEFYYQEFIPGSSYYLLYYFSKNGNVKKFSQKNLLQQEDGKSILVAESSEVHNEHISQQYETLFKSLNFYGLVMVEIKSFNNKYYMIEANPRFWGPSQLFVDANVNFFEELLIDCGFDLKNTLKNMPISKVKYFWDDGVSKNLNQRIKIAFHDYSKENFLKDLPELLKIEVYSRLDVARRNMSKIEQLKEMYKAQSKHSNYQILPNMLREIVNQDNLKIHSRHEQERLKYILDNVDLTNKKILDVGGNSGYFTFEALSHKAKSVDYFEGNFEHSEFVKLSSEILNLQKVIKIKNEYFDFNSAENYDVGFILNVLHHIGDDFGDMQISKKNALEKISKILNGIAEYVDILVFQLGFNWKGDRNLPLFENGTKQEMINFVNDSIKNKFKIINIGVAVSTSMGTCYENINEKNIERNDSLGEFLNRPIFILKRINA